MKRRKFVLGSVSSLGLLAGGALASRAAQPGQGADRRHPNLMEAQHFVARAYQKVLDAQRANEWDMDGHAARAKDHLDQASKEIKFAAEAANHH
jgi:hypothetical protein